MNTKNEWDVRPPESDQAAKDVGSEVSAEYEAKLQAEIDSRNEERFFWIFTVIIGIDMLVYPHLPASAAIFISLLEIVLLIGLASHLGVDKVVVLLSRILNKYLDK